MHLIQLYNFIFGDGAIISAERKPVDKREAYIKEQHDRIKTEFASMIQEGSPVGQRELFYSLLMSVKTPGTEALKEILYTQEERNYFSTKLKEKSYPFPDESAIRANFKKFNDKFNYFKDEAAQQAEDDFIVFFRACKLTADFIEHNNSQDDSVAYEHAYKMLVVLGASHEKRQSIFKLVQDYFKKFAKGDKPIHDALVQNLPVNDPPLQDISGWRALIQKSGYKALGVFQQAQGIEKLLKGKAPTDMVEAIDAAMKVSYARAEEYPELARLCKKYSVSEDHFNKCLEIERDRKKQDVLPVVSVSGAAIGLAGYHLVKLPIDDPHAYLLGNITNCCQRIGGESELCVIDGITREHNGFYVLLKGKPGVEPMIDGKINYDYFKIVGQTYAWLSEEGSLTLDSWENLRPEVDDPVAVELLKTFSEKVTTASDDVLRVTIGMGGKTPQFFQTQSELVQHPEKISEGFQYGDSYKQALIFLNKEKLDKLIDSAVQKHTSALSGNLWETEESCRDFFSSFSFTSCRYFQRLDALLTGSPGFWREGLVLNNNLQIFEGIGNVNIQIINLLYEMQQAGLLTQDNFNRIVFHFDSNLDTIREDSIGEVADGVTWLSKANLLDEENFKLLITHIGALTRPLSELAKVSVYDATIFNMLLKHLDHANNLASVLPDMAKHNLLTPENIQLLGDFSEHACSIANALLPLRQANLITDANFKMIMKRPEHARAIADGLIALSRKNIVTEDNCKLLIEHAQHGYYIGHGLVQLAEKNILTDATRKFLSDSPEYARSITGGLVSLASAKILSDENIRFVMRNPEAANTLAEILVILSNNNLLNVENCNKLSAISDSLVLYNLKDGLEYLQRERIFNQDNFTLLIDHAHSPQQLAHGLKAMTTEKIELSAENTRLLVANTQNARSLEAAFKAIAMVRSVTDDDFKLLISHPFLESLARGMAALQKAGLLNEDRMLFLSKQGENAFNIAKGIVLLSNLKISLTEDNIKLIIESIRLNKNFTNALDILSESGVLTDDNFKFIAIHAQISDKMAVLCVSLSNANLLSDANKKLLSEQAEHIESLAEGANLLANKKLLTQENFSLLVTKSDSLIKALRYLSARDLLTEENLSLLFQYSDNATNIAFGLARLNDANLLTAHGRSVLLVEPENAREIATELVKLVRDLTEFQEKPASAHMAYSIMSSSKLDEPSSHSQFERRVASKILKLMAGEVAVFENTEFEKLGGTELGMLLQDKSKILPKAYLDAQQQYTETYSHVSPADISKYRNE